MTLLLIDNYDSFTYNLYQYFGELYGEKIVVKRNDEISIDEVIEMKLDYIVFSPGPGNPTQEKDFGICKKILEEVSPTIPTLGVCLGHQGIGVSFGGTIERASQIKHGKTSTIIHSNSSIFKNIPNPITGARYHSLIVSTEDFPDQLEILAKSEDGEIMAMKHKQFPIFGIQFHPESILTYDGKDILRNFLKINIHK